MSEIDALQFFIMMIAFALIQGITFGVLLKVVSN